MILYWIGCYIFNGVRYEMLLLCDNVLSIFFFSFFFFPFIQVGVGWTFQIQQGQHTDVYIASITKTYQKYTF